MLSHVVGERAAVLSEHPQVVREENPRLSSFAEAVCERFDDVEPLSSVLDEDREDLEPLAEHGGSLSEGISLFPAVVSRLADGRGPLGAATSELVERRDETPSRRDV